MMHSYFLYSLGLVGLANSLYVPESGDDWTLLRPDSECPYGSFDTIPFEIGIVANPYYYDENGELYAPEPTEHVVTKTYTELTTIRSTSTANPAIQIEDGQVQKLQYYSEDYDNDWDFHKRDDSFSWEESPQVPDFGLDDHHEHYDTPINAVACRSDITLSMTLTNSILRDSKNRIGSIVSDHQFQFDGPLPQYGTHYAAGWSVTSDGKLALGDCTTFYQCASGDFYNLYDTHIAPQCHPVSLDVVELIDC